MEKQKRIIKIRIVNTDDWTGFYVDGKLKEENHSLRLDECLLILQEETKEPASIDFGIFWTDGYLEEFGNSCPSNWTDLSIYPNYVD